eukprot:8324045-Heterocapsa_arctica.AAC.1
MASVRGIAVRRVGERARGGEALEAVGRLSSTAPTEVRFARLPVRPLRLLRGGRECRHVRLECQSAERFEL